MKKLIKVKKIEKTKAKDSKKVNVFRVVKKRKKEKTVNLDELISLTEASKLCSYSQEYLSLMARKGKIDAVKNGRNWKISRRVLFAYIEEHNLELAGNNRGRFSKRANEVVKVYKQEKVIKKINPFNEAIKNSNFKLFNVKSLLSAPVVTLMLLFVFAFVPGSTKLLSTGLGFVNNLFQATVVRGADLSRESLVETKKIVIEMRRYISGESRRENKTASQLVLDKQTNNSDKHWFGWYNNFNNYIVYRVVDPYLGNFFEKTKLFSLNETPFNILKWNLDNYPEKIVAVNVVNPKVEQKIASVFNDFSLNQGVQPRVAGVQEYANEQKPRQDNVVLRLFEFLVSMFESGN